MTTRLESTPFAKLFHFADGRQVAAYLDTGTNLGLCFRGVSLDVAITNRATLPAELPREVAEKALPALLERVQEPLAREVLNTINKMVDAKVPFGRELSQMRGASQTFARFVEAAGEKALVVSIEENEMPSLLFVTQQGNAVVHFADPLSRSAAFENPLGLAGRKSLPAIIESFVSAEPPVRRRGPRP